MVIGVVVVFLLALIKATEIPLFRGDPQYYVQAGLLWPEGQTTFAASLIGSRHLTVLYYRAFLLFTGYTLEGLSLALGLLYLVSSLSVLWLSFLVLRSRWVALATATFLALLSFCLPVWTFPMTDPIYIALVDVLILCWCIASTRNLQPAMLGFLGLVAGLSTGVREGAVALLVLLTASTGILRRVRGRSIVVGSAIMLAVYILSAAFVSQSWSLWIPAERPYGYTYAFLFTTSIHRLAHAHDGPASLSLARDLGLGDDEKIPFWVSVGFTYREYGAQEGDRILRDVGLETIRARPLEYVDRVLIDLKDYVFEEQRIVTIDDSSWEERRETSHRRLLELDQVRVNTSAQFGNDAYTATAFIAERSFQPLEALRNIVPSIRLVLRPPGYIAMTFAVICALSILWLGTPSREVALASAIYGVFMVLLAALTQGYDRRYGEMVQSQLISHGVLALVSIVAGQSRVSPAAAPSGGASVAAAPARDN